MKKFNAATLSIFAIILGGCGEQFDVKYLSCDIQGKNCLTVAKFKSLDECERIKFRDSAYCDQVSVPGKMICDTQRKSTISAGFCTK
jgi:hypothetical protein